MHLRVGQSDGDVGRVAVDGEEPDALTIQGVDVPRNDTDSVGTDSDDQPFTEHEGDRQPASVSIMKRLPTLVPTASGFVLGCRHNTAVRLRRWVLAVCGQMKQQRVTART
jgi:hypothetical protein